MITNLAPPRPLLTLIPSPGPLTLARNPQNIPLGAEGIQTYSERYERYVTQ